LQKFCEFHHNGGKVKGFILKQQWCAIIIFIKNDLGTSVDSLCTKKGLAHCCWKKLQAQIKLDNWPFSGFGLKTMYHYSMQQPDTAKIAMYYK